MAVQSIPIACRTGDRSLRAPLRVGIAMFVVYHLTIALLMAAAPHTFFKLIGPFGVYNAHYIRDTATFEAAIGAALAISLRRPAWRTPVLTLMTIQFALHSANHLLDIADAHPAWTGYADFVSLFAATLALLWLVRLAAAEQAAPDTPLAAPVTPLAEGGPR